MKNTVFHNRHSLQVVSVKWSHMKPEHTDDGDALWIRQLNASPALGRVPETFPPSWEQQNGYLSETYAEHLLMSRITPLFNYFAGDVVINSRYRYGCEFHSILRFLLDNSNLPVYWQGSQSSGKRDTIYLSSVLLQW